MACFRMKHEKFPPWEFITKGVVEEIFMPRLWYKNSSVAPLLWLKINTLLFLRCEDLSRSFLFWIMEEALFPFWWKFSWMNSSGIFQHDFLYKRSCCAFGMKISPRKKSFDVKIFKEWPWNSLRGNSIEPSTQSSSGMVSHPNHFSFRGISHQNLIYGKRRAGENLYQRPSTTQNEILFCLHHSFI